MTPQKLALCVGINYPGTSAELAGCVNDAMDWTQALYDRGYTVTTMIDQAATKANIVAHLNAMGETLRYRDRFVFTFSGHGTWVPDVDGDEADLRDEALCCADYASGGLLVDDELHTIWSRFRHGVRKVSIPDSCHSGTVARGFLNAAQVQGTPKFLSPAVLPTVPVTEEQAIRVEALARPARSRPGPILMSGCSDPEYSYDAWFNGRPNGAFTRAALDALKLNPISYRMWHALIKQQLPSATYPQTPQLGASRYQQHLNPL